MIKKIAELLMIFSFSVISFFILSLMISAWENLLEKIFAVYFTL